MAASNIDDQPYIILLGDVGTGKSTIVEKLTGETGRSSDSKHVGTEASECFEIFNGVIICDTPGTNALTNRFGHNIHVAHAMNSRPVRCILIVSKADTRISNTVKNVGEYVERLMPTYFPEELISVCITHMDTVKWERKDILPHLAEQLEITSVFCSSLTTTDENLKHDLLENCVFGKKAFNLNIEANAFLKVFNISNTSKKVYRLAKAEIERFDKMSLDFETENKKFPSEADQKDLIFEFQAWLNEEYVKAQKRFSDKNQFTLYGPNMVTEAGHVANMSNQLGKLVRLVRSKAEKYLKGAKTAFRSCPHCGEVWTKVEGCAGSTTCGRRPKKNKSDNVNVSDVMANFVIQWDTKLERLRITKRGTKVRQRENRAGRQSADQEQPAGCGKTIAWKEMKPCKFPEALMDCENLLETQALPDEGQANFQNKYEQAMEAGNKCLRCITVTIQYHPLYQA